MSNNIEAEQLEKFGATCSVCGQAFSSSANIASVAELANQKYKGKKVNIATCRQFHRTFISIQRRIQPLRPFTKLQITKLASSP